MRSKRGMLDCYIFPPLVVRSFFFPRAAKRLCTEFSFSF